MTALTGKLETILVVDSHEGVLNVVVDILQRSNFQVLFATSSSAAVGLAAETDIPIQLLISSVDLPLMSGPELGEALKKSRPDMRVMLMAGGYNGRLLVLNYGWAYIQKPFLPVRLVEMVLQVLNPTHRSTAGGQKFDTGKETKNIGGVR